MANDYYDILGVPRNASKDEIKKAYRNLAHKFHPDKKGGNEKKFKEVTEAYAILSDDRRRSEYDTYGRTFAGGEGGGTPGAGFDWSEFIRQSGFGGASGADFDFADIFGDFFGGGHSGGAKRGRDISIDIELPFAEAVFGAERRILIRKLGICDLCNGSGAKRGSPLETCGTCNGKGKVHEVKRSFIFGSMQTVRTCERCRGGGKVPKDVCDRCRGEGVVDKQEEVAVKIPPGIDNGEMIRIGGAGEAARGGSPGDLYIKVHVKRDPRFRREGSDLVTELPIKLTSALLGDEYALSTLDGEIKIKIPSGIRFGEILRVRGKGVPHDGGRRGDLLVKVLITIPGKFTKEAKQRIEELRKEGL